MHRRGEPSLLGETLGPYYIKDRLGQGGMGAVYLARDTALDRNVALKILLARHAEDSEFVARFQREARAVAKLNHPNIVQVYTVDIASDRPYMAMEYVEGKDLESYIRTHGRLGWQQALGFVMQVADALSCAHAANIIHRDIKPANILIDHKGRARVTDFGIAKVMGSNTNLTGTEHTVGSPTYMSPEQCGVGEIGPPSDLFSLGIMLYEMITGTVPFKGESSISIMRQIADKDVPPLSDSVDGVPPAVQEILSSLTFRDLKFRYGTASQVLSDLKALQRGGTMEHAQSLNLRKAAQGPASQSAADLTRSPTGTGVSLSDSLVESLLEGTQSNKERPKVRRNIEVPWMGILVTGALIFFGILAVLYYKGLDEMRLNPPEAKQPPAPVEQEGPPAYSPPPGPPQYEGPPPRRGPHPPPGVHPDGPPPPRPGDGRRPPPPQRQQ